MKKRVMLILSCLFLSIGFIAAQSTSVSGTVLDGTGEPVIGASVVVKGTTTGTITDVDGKFTINVPTGKNALVFSLIGMKTVEHKAVQGMDVVMEDVAKELEEVMVVAYGTAKKSAFTGSAAVINSDMITKRQTSNIANALAGQVAGVQILSTTGQPGSTPNVRIRGVGSISSSNNPLYVVDGVPFEGDLSTLNSSDIESMTVLKDAAANALYGARGANGVILITTRGATGAKPKVHIDMKWGSNSRALSDYDIMTSPTLYYEKFYEGLYNSKLSPLNGAAGTPVNARKHALETLLSKSDGGLGYQVYTIPNGEDFITMDGKLNPNAKLGYSDGTNYFTPDNWKNVMFDNQLRQEYNVNVTGRSTDGIGYYFSAGYLDDKGIIPGSSFERYTTRTKIDYNVKSWLTLRTNLAYVNYNNNYPDGQTSNGNSSNAFYAANMIAPIYPIYVRNADGSVKVDHRGLTVYDFGDNTGFGRAFLSQSNPMSVLSLDKTSYKSDVFSGKWGADFHLYEGLKATANIGYDVNNEKYRRLYNPYYGQYANSSGGIIYVGADKNTIRNIQYLLTYSKSIGNHDFDALFGYESYMYRFESLMGSKTKVFDPNIVEINNAILSPSASSYTSKYSTESYLGRVQYNYDNEYFASASFRSDGSSRFHKDNRWGTFWSGSAAWLLNKKLLKDVSEIDLLKFKISYGEQGNDRLLYENGSLNYYPSMNQYDLVNNNGDFATPSSYVGNKNITWETSQTFNTGIDFGFFNGKLSGSIEYFSRKTVDMLYYKPVPLSGGFAKIPMNVGSMTNSGFEIDLTTKIIDNTDFGWTISANLTHVKNKINKLDTSLKGQFIDGSRIYSEGESMYRLYMRSYAGVDPNNGNALWYKDVKDADGNITRATTNVAAEATYYATDDLLNDFYGGFGTNLDYKGFDFSMSFAYQIGGKVYDNTYASLMHSGSSSDAGTNWHKDILKAWTVDNPNTNVPQLNASYGTANSLSDRFLTNASYLSLQNIVLGYTLPKSFMSKIDIQSIRIYGVVDNVALFSKRKGMDPRQSFTAVGSYNYAPIRTISGGVSVTF